MLVVNSQLIKGTGASPAPPGKFILNDFTIIFFSTSQQHNSVKQHGLSYEDDYRGNACAGIFTGNHIEIRFHRDSTDERLRRIWSQVCAHPELTFLKEREVYYQGRKLLNGMTKNLPTTPEGNRRLQLATLLSILLPLGIGGVLSISLGLSIWRGFYFVFSWIGFCISLGNFIGFKTARKSLGRHLCILLIAPIFLVFFGVLQRENMQLEETVFYGAYFLSTGIFTRVLIHFAIAKVFGPFIWGRGFCGWACWTAALLDWLPITTNRPIPRAWTWLRIPALLLSLLIPFVLIRNGYPYLAKHIAGDSGQWIQTQKWTQFLWFLTGNGLYYVMAILLAYAFGKQRAFCKILCPVSLLMKAQTKAALIKVTPSGEECIHCQKCNTNCPMDVDVESYIGSGQKIASSECILCRTCANVCPTKAIL